MNNKHVLILGGAGFIGSNLASTLLHKKYHVSIIDGLCPSTGGQINNIKPFLQQLENFVPKKIENIPNLEQYFKGIHVVIDAMALTNHLLGMEQPTLDMSHNYTPHITYLERCAHNLKGIKIIYLGSRSSYGNPDHKDIDEHTPCHPVDIQGAHKLAAEHIIGILQKKYQYTFTSLRIANCFGPNMDLDNNPGLIGMFIKNSLEGRTTEVYGNPNRVKSIVHVSDLCDIIECIINTDKPLEKLYNIAGSEISIKEILNAISKPSDKNQYKTIDFPDSVRDIDIGCSHFNDKKIRNFLSYSYSDTKQNLKNTLLHYKTKREDKHDITM